MVGPLGWHIENFVFLPHSPTFVSGTLSPLGLYPKILDFRPAVVDSLNMTTARNCICPMIVTKGSDQVAITSKYDQRDDTGVIQVVTTTPLGAMFDARHLLLT